MRPAGSIGPRRSCLKSWRDDIDRTQWQTLLAAHLGWLLDGFDVMLYAFAILKIQEEFKIDKSVAPKLLHTVRGVGYVLKVE